MINQRKSAPLSLEDEKSTERFLKFTPCLFVVIFLLFLQTSLISQTCTNDPAQHSTGKFGTCDQSGKGGDPELNRLKNRDLPPNSYKSYTINDIINNIPQDLPTMMRAKWDPAESDDACMYEQQGIVVEGVLLGVKQEGPEACNCRITDQRDYHLWLGPQKGASRADGIVVEISPRLIPQHPSWNQTTLGKFVKQGSKVRISGWLMWDEEHGDQVGKTRGTHWEIHPIHKIEVFTGGKWTEL